MLLLTLPLFACTEPLPTQGSFSVLSYNVHGLPSVITGDDTPDRMLQIAPLLIEHDLIGLQEDFDDANHQALVADAPHAFQERFSAEVEDSRAYGSGLGVLSMMEIVQAEGIEACLACMDRHIGSAEVQLSSLGALTNLICNNI